MKRHRKKRTLMPLTVLLIAGVIVGVVAGSTIGSISWEQKLKTSASQIRKEEQAKLDAVQKELDALKEQINREEAELPWNLVLVNPTTYMKEGYVPELTTISGGYKVDSRIADATNQMLADAKKAGLDVVVCSAYRSVEQQKQVFSDSMKRRVNSGMRYWEAYVETTKNVAVPGTSEHSLGLALDLIARSYQGLDEQQANTAEAKWLAANCHKYGFILRYPSEKSDITGIVFEPWHFRYVGVEHATKIMESGMVLEEYLQQYQKGE